MHHAPLFLVLDISHPPLFDILIFPLFMAPRIKFEPFDHIEDWHEALVDAKSAIYG